MSEHSPQSRQAVTDGWLPEIVAIVGALALVFFWEKAGDCVDEFVDGRRGNLYGALLGLHATLLGFILAALAIVLGYINSPNFTLVRESGKFAPLFSVFMAGTRTEALATAAALIALLSDRERHPHGVLPALLAALTVLAFLRLARTLWVMRLVVSILVKPVEDEDQDDATDRGLNRGIH